MEGLFLTVRHFLSLSQFKHILCSLTKQAAQLGWQPVSAVDEAPGVALLEGWGLLQEDFRSSPNIWFLGLERGLARRGGDLGCTLPLG